MNEYEQTGLNNKLIVAIVNGRTDKAKALLNDGANPLSYECRPVIEAINHDNLDILKQILSKPENIQHLENNPDKLYMAFVADREEKTNCLIYLIQETKIDFQGMYEKQGSSYLNETIEFVKKITLNTTLQERPLRPKLKAKSLIMKI